MAFREVPMFEVREVLRLWLGGEGLRSVARLSRVDRKTVRRYVDAAIEAGVIADCGVAQLTDEVLGRVVELVRPHRIDGHGHSWAALDAKRDKVEAWVAQGVAGVKICELLARDGVVVAQRTVQRFIATEFGPRRGQGATVRIADGEPGHELQIDFARLGLINDALTGRRRVCHALIFTAVFSRHMFVWLSFSQTTDAVIAGCEAAWQFFGGVFRVLIPDNLTPVVTKAERIEPRFNEAFVEYAQTRGFVIDPARVRTPTDKPRVERMVQFVRSSFWAGETFFDLNDAQAKATAWCAGRAGTRIHGTTQCRPVEHFRLDEQPHLLPAPADHYDLPIYASCRVHRDHHIEIAKALYSIPGNLLGARVQVRADRKLVRVFHRSQLIKVHPRQAPGQRSTDPADLPAEQTTYALRDIAHLQKMAASHGEAIGAYAAAVLDTALPWTKMRQVYALLGLVKKWGPDKVAAACKRALDAEAINVALIGRMLERATENVESEPPSAPPAATRFARNPGEYTTPAAKAWRSA
jgi:transposase